MPQIFPFETDASGGVPWNHWSPGWRSIVRVPASKPELLTLTKELAARHANRGAWSSVLALAGRTSFADRTIALRNLYRGVGLNALVKGFDWAKPHLEKQILNDKRITIYPGGRSDIENHRVNVRVLAMIAYLAEAHGQVTVSCLISGHRLYARPGVISASNMPGPFAAFSAAAPPRSTAVSSFSPTLTGRDTCLPFAYTASTM